MPAIDIAIESDEDINGSRQTSTSCVTNISVDNSADPDMEDLSLTNFVNNRTGNADGRFRLRSRLDVRRCQRCPDDFRHSASLSRPGNNWVYAWRNASTELKSRHLDDGLIVVVVWGRDRNHIQGARRR